MDLDQLARALDAFKALEAAQLPAHHIRLFIEIARHGPITYRELEDRLLTTNASISRGVQALSDSRIDGRPGLGLVSTYSDPEEGRRLLVKLSKRGHLVKAQLQAL